MSRLVAIYLLFCLAFLNVPKFVVHDCQDHSHATEVKLDQQDSDELPSDVSLESDDCFICEFDLGYYSVPFSLSASNNPDPAIPFVERKVIVSSITYFDSYLLRGPPTC